MLDTGGYRLIYYNRYGTCLKHIKHTGTAYTSTLEKAEAFLKRASKKHKKKGGDVKLVPVSYTVDRRIFNSLDKAANFQ